MHVVERVAAAQLLVGAAALARLAFVNIERIIDFAPDADAEYSLSNFHNLLVSPISRLPVPGLAIRKRRPAACRRPRRPPEAC